MRCANTFKFSRYIFPFSVSFVNLILAEISTFFFFFFLGGGGGEGRTNSLNDAHAKSITQVRSPLAFY